VAGSAGPLWTGPLWERALVERMLSDPRPLAVAAEVRRALRGWLEEAAGPPLFYDVHAAAARLGASAPRLERTVQRLRAEGFRAVRTHLSRVGIRTDAGAEEFFRCMR
jgi:tRNA G26 N,N-dimethylase Trm1